MSTPKVVSLTPAQAAALKRCQTIQMGADYRA